MSEPAMAGPDINQPWPGIDFVNAYKRFWTKYATFTGRAAIGEYWWAFLGNVVLGGVVYILGTMSHPLMFVYYLFSLAALCPGIAIGVRRMHDINKSGWWVAISLVPCIGFIWFIVLACQPSNPAGAQYDA